MRKKILFASAVVAGAMQASAQVPSWVYDPDSNQIPNATGQPFEGGSVAGSNDTRSLVDLGGGDYVFQFDTGPDGPPVASYFELVGPTTNWNVSVATGYSVEWRLRMDPTAVTSESAAGWFAGNPSNWAFMRSYDRLINPTTGERYLAVEIQDSSGGVGARVHNLGKRDAWHTYRMDVRNVVGVPTVALYVDNYHSPVIRKPLAAGAAHSTFFGDGTGQNNGKYQIDSMKAWLNGAVGAPARPNAAVIDSTIFHASFDGNTGNGGLNADFARGSRDAFGLGGILTTNSKFGDGALDAHTAGGTVDYPSQDNFNVEQGTVEMWAKTENWSNGGFYGFFNLYQSSVCDIRLQKTASDQLQLYFADLVGGTSWSLTTRDPISLNNDWHHVAVSWDEGVNMAYLYIDGQVVADFNATFPTPPNPGQTAGLTGVDYLGTLAPGFEVGSIQGGSSPFEGLIDEFRISNKDLYQGGVFTPQNGAFALQKWNVDSDGQWSNALNWTGGVPDGTGATANFLADISIARTVTVDSPRSVGVLNFNSAAGYTIGGTGTLLVEVGLGSGSITSPQAKISSLQGSHVISAPMVLASNTTVSVSTGSSLAITRDIGSIGSIALTKQGGGLLTLNHLRFDSVSVTDGTARVASNGSASATSVVRQVSVSGAAKLDLTNNDLVVTNGDTVAIRALVAAGYAGGAWNGAGINSSVAAAGATTALAVANNSELNLVTFSGQAVGPTDVLVAYTRYGDADLSGSVSLDDFTRLAAGFGSIGSTWTRGDFNYDGFTNLDDFTALAANFGQSTPADPPRAVPEPASLLWGAAGLALLKRVRRP